MSRLVLVLTRLVVLAVTFAAILGPSFNPADQKVLAANNPVELVVENLNGSQFVYVVFHALDRDGFCNPPAGAVSLHPVLGIPVDFVIEAGDGVIIQNSGGAASFGRSATGVTAFSTAVNAVSASPIRSFAPLVQGITDECQAWIKVSQSLPGPLRVLVSVPGDDGGNIGFVADLARPQTVELTLNFRWSLVSWQGADGMAPADALRGPAGATDITGQVTAVYGWEAAGQAWRAFFPSGASLPGANDLNALKAGAAYWIAVTGPGNVTWSIAKAN